MNTSNICLPLELDNLEDPDDTSKCGQTQSVVNTYSMISDTLSLLEKKLQEERQNYKKEAQRYQKEIVNTENYILRKCKCRSSQGVLQKEIL